MADPRYAMYLDGWPRQGDDGLVAVQEALFADTRPSAAHLIGGSRLSGGTRRRREGPAARARRPAGRVLGCLELRL